MHSRWTAVLLLLAFTCAAVAARALLGERFEPAALVATLREVGASGLAGPVFLLLFGAGTTLFLPAVSFMLVAGVTWGLWPGWAVAWAAANLWAHLHFLVGRALGRERLLAFLARRGLGRVHRELEAGGVWATVILRQLPLPFVGVNVAAGASPLTWRAWALGNVLGLLPNVLVYTHLAATLADGLEAQGLAALGRSPQAVGRALLAAAGVVAFALVSRWLAARGRRRADVGRPE